MSFQDIDRRPSKNDPNRFACFVSILKWTEKWEQEKLAVRLRLFNTCKSFFNVIGHQNIILLVLTERCLPSSRFCQSGKRNQVLNLKSQFSRCKRVVFLLILLFLLAVHIGCRPRELVSPTPQMDIESKFWVSVLLLKNVTDCELKVPTSFSVTCFNTGSFNQTSYARFEKLEIPSKIEISADRIIIAGRPFTADKIIIVPDSPHILNLDGSDYRGKLKVIINTDTNSFDVINLVPLEPYLAGVVGAEMPDYWEPEALKAQAITARTYCLYIKNHFGKNRDWDLNKTQANQVYQGIKAESVQVWNAINQTYGQVLVSKHSGGIEDIFPAYYSSVCGGHTENSKNVFGDSFEPLRGVLCPYCKNVAKLSLFFWLEAKFDRITVTERLHKRYPNLKQLGEIKSIEAIERSDYGRFSRMTKVKLVGSTGKSDFLRAEDLRLAIDPTGRQIKSTICYIIKTSDGWAFSAGRGWGHGVGMCQCGAEGMAREGKTARQILSYYYPGSKIVKIDY